MIIQNNLPAMNANRNLLANQEVLTKSTEKASTGFRINRAGDDAAGLAISEKMRAQIRGLSVSTKNTRDGINLIQTAEGALEESHSILRRIRELAVQAANGVYDNNIDNVALNKEVERLKQELDRISTYTNFNNINLLDGNLTSPTQVHTRLGSDGNELLSIGIVVGIEAEKAQTYSIDLASLGFDFTQSADAADTYSIKIGAISLQSNAVGTKALENTKDIAALFHGRTIAPTANSEYTVSAIGTKLEFTMTKNNGKAITANNAAVSKPDLLSLNETVTFSSGSSAISATTGANMTGKLKEVREGTNEKDVRSTLTKAAFSALKLREGDSLTISEYTAGGQVEHTFQFVEAGSDPLNRNGAGSTFTTLEELAVALNTRTTNLLATANNELGIFIVPKDAASVTDISTKFNSINHSAESIVTFYDGIRSGTTITIKNETYEFVAHEKEAVSGNHAVVINALSGGAALTGVQAATALNRYLDANTLVGYTNSIGKVAGINDNSVIISTLATGKEARNANIHANSSGLTFQIGANNSSDERVSLNVSSTDSRSLGVRGVRIENQYDANQAIATIDEAINFTSAIRSELGALQNRLEHTVSNLSVAEESLTSAESRIRDVDLAKEMMIYAKSTILSLSTRRMLASANIGPKSVLSLLK